jgi:hypothetical protein
MVYSKRYVMTVMKVRNAANDGWITVGGGVDIVQQDAAPASTYPGQLWVDTNQGSGVMPGLFTRPQFEYKDANEVTMSAGAYHHDGTTEQMVSWDSSFDITVTATSGWNYLYIDDSAVVTLDTYTLTASEFIFSTTGPTWSNTKHGWYNGLDRCIFATFNTAASVQAEFFNDGSRQVTFADAVTVLSETDIDTTWVDVTMRAPAFCTRVEVTVIGDSGPGATGATNYYYWRTNGQTGAVGHTIGYHYRVSGDTDTSAGTFLGITDSSQVIEVRHSIAGGQTLRIYHNSWFLPRGM